MVMTHFSSAKLTERLYFNLNVFMCTLEHLFGACFVRMSAARTKYTNLTSAFLYISSQKKRRHFIGSCRCSNICYYRATFQRLRRSPPPSSPHLTAHRSASSRRISLATNKSCSHWSRSGASAIPFPNSCICCRQQRARRPTCACSAFEFLVPMVTGTL